MVRHLMDKETTVFVNGRKENRVRQVADERFSEGTAPPAPGHICFHEEVMDG